MALAGKIDRSDYRVFVLMGDGETHEGSVWEAAASAAKFRLDNLVGIVDRNGLCVDGALDDVMPMEPLAAKWQAFGWDTVEVDGHDFPSLLEGLDVPRSRAACTRTTTPITSITAPSTMVATAVRRSSSTPSSSASCSPTRSSQTLSRSGCACDRRCRGVTTASPDPARR